MTVLDLTPKLTKARLRANEKAFREWLKTATPEQLNGPEMAAKLAETRAILADCDDETRAPYELQSYGPGPKAG